MERVWNGLKGTLCLLHPIIVLTKTSKPEKLLHLKILYAQNIIKNNIPVVKFS